ncbi:general substrate transporter [Lipomyces starkeyi]
MGAFGNMASKHVSDVGAGQGHFERAPPADADNEMSFTIWETIKRNPNSIIYSLLLATGPMVYGYDLMVVNVIVAMPSFQMEFGSLINGSYIVPALWLALWNSMIQVGAIAGSLISGPISNRWGHCFWSRWFCCSRWLLIGVFLVYFADRCDTLDARRVVFMLGKILEGSGLAIMNATCLTLISEIAPPRVRGPLLSCFTLFTMVGQIIGVSATFAQIAILDKSSYHVVLAVQRAKAYRRLHPKAEVDREVTFLQTVVEHEMDVQKGQESSNLIQCFKGTDFRRTRIIIYAFILQQFVGITMVANATYFLELAGISPNLSLTIVEMGLGIPSIIASWFTMTIFGHRAILLIGSLLSTVLWLAMGIAGCFPNSSTAMWFIGIVMVIIFVVYSLSVGAAYPDVAAESSSLHLRAASQSIGFFSQFLFGWLFSFTIPYMFGVDAGNLGGKVGFIFSALSVIAIAMVWFEIPEMKNRPFAELDEMFEKKIPTRQFNKYVCGGILPAITKAEQAGV